MQMGASGYLLKDAAMIELQLALQSVLVGHRYLSPRVAGQVIDAAFGRGGEDPLELLTSRQQEVLYWQAKGKGNKEVAFILNLSVKTVDNRRQWSRYGRFADLYIPSPRNAHPYPEERFASRT